MGRRGREAGVVGPEKTRFGARIFCARTLDLESFRVEARVPLCEACSSSIVTGKRKERGYKQGGHVSLARFCFVY